MPQDSGLGRDIEVLRRGALALRKCFGVSDAENAAIDKRIARENADWASPRNQRVLARIRYAEAMEGWECPDIVALELQSWGKERKVKWTPFERDYSKIVTNQPQKVEKRLKDIELG